MASSIDNMASPPDLGDHIRLTEAEAEAKVAYWIKENNLNQKTPDAGEVHFSDFLALVQNAVIARQNFERVKAKDRILFIEKDPPESIDTEAITCFLKSRVPGRWDRGPAGVGRIKEVRAHLRSVIQHPDHPTEKLLTFGRMYDNWFGFNVYARDTKTASRRVIWFERVMDTFNWYFKHFGFVVVEEGVGDRERVTVDELELAMYPLTYMVRMDETFQSTSQELRAITLSADVTIS